MKYSDYLHSLPESHCPFCEPGQRVYRRNDSAYLTYALAPYHRHHLLIIPNRHVLSLLDMSEGETTRLWALIREGMETLRKLGYHNLSVLVREGEVGLAGPRWVLAGLRRVRRALVHAPRNRPVSHDSLPGPRRTLHELPRD